MSTYPRGTKPLELTSLRLVLFAALLALAVVLSFRSPRPVLAHGSVDQTSPNASYSIGIHYAMIFVPQKDNIVAFDVLHYCNQSMTFTIRPWTRTGGGYGYAGADLFPGISFVSNNGVNHVDIPGGPIALTPGATYELVDISPQSGSECTGGGPGTSYGPGDVLYGGTEWNAFDLYFVTYYQPPLASLTIVKHTIGGDGTFAFSSTGGLSPASPSITTTGGTGSQIYTNITPGTYSVTESAAPAGWLFTSLICTTGATVSGQTATIVLAAGANVTCTYTNTKEATLTLVKAVSGGPAPASAWTLSATGPGTLSGASGGATVTSVFVPPGAYTLAESGGPGGYTSSGWACTGGVSVSNSQITLAAGQVTTCTVTNLGSADVSVSKTVASALEPAGATLTYTITVNNAGPTPAVTLSLTDTTPVNTTFVSLASAPGWSCSSPAAGANGAITCTSATLAVGAPQAFKLMVKINLGTAAATVITNTATVTAATNDPNPAPNNSATAVATVATPSQAAGNLIATITGSAANGSVATVLANQLPSVQRYLGLHSVYGSQAACAVLNSFKYLANLYASIPLVTGVTPATAAAWIAQVDLIRAGIPC